MNTVPHGTDPVDRRTKAAVFCFIGANQSSPSGRGKGKGKREKGTTNINVGAIGEDVEILLDAMILFFLSINKLGLRPTCVSSSSPFPLPPSSFPSETKFWSHPLSVTTSLGSWFFGFYFWSRYGSGR